MRQRVGRSRCGSADFNMLSAGSPRDRRKAHSAKTRSDFRAAHHGYWQPLQKLAASSPLKCLWEQMPNQIRSIRSIMTGLGFFAIARGIRMPPPKMVYDFYQWGRLIDLIHRLDINVFLDVGANRGFFSKHLRMSGYKGRLISFEPVPEDQEHIYQFARHDNDWQVCRYALGAETGRKQFRINLSCNETVLSSFLPLRGQSSSKIINVEINRLDYIFPQLIRRHNYPPSIP